MIVYPAMDLMDGCVVRLEQGRFDAATIYPSDPAEALDQFAAAGAEWAHLVDLDGARAQLAHTRSAVEEARSEAERLLGRLSTFRDAAGDRA